jgi:hypothetical protein
VGDLQPELQGIHRTTLAQMLIQGFEPGGAACRQPFELAGQVKTLRRQAGGWRRWLKGGFVVVHR